MWEISGHESPWIIHATKPESQINFKFKLGHKDFKGMIILLLKLLIPNPIQCRGEISF